MPYRTAERRHPIIDEPGCFDRRTLPGWVHGINADFWSLEIRHKLHESALVYIVCDQKVRQKTTPLSSSAAARQVSPLLVCNREFVRTPPVSQ